MAAKSLTTNSAAVAKKDEDATLSANDGAEQSRKRAEVGRRGAERSRSAAENKRETQEEHRDFAEDGRRSAEDARTWAEDARLARDETRTLVDDARRLFEQIDSKRRAVAMALRRALAATEARAQAEDDGGLALKEQRMLESLWDNLIEVKPDVKKRTNH